MMRQYGLGVAFCLFATFCQAEQYALVLNSLEKIHAGEAGGDELYMVVAEYDNVGKDEISETPEFPLHWFSDALASIHDQVIWQGNLNNGEALELRVELNERDLGIFSSGSHIGGVRILLNQSEDGLTEIWQSKDGNGSSQEDLALGSAHEYTWQSDKAAYKIRLGLKEKA